MSIHPQSDWFSHEQACTRRGNTLLACIAQASDDMIHWSQATAARWVQEQRPPFAKFCPRPSGKPCELHLGTAATACAAGTPNCSARLCGKRDGTWQAQPLLSDLPGGNVAALSARPEQCTVREVLLALAQRGRRRNLRRGGHGGLQPWPNRFRRLEISQAL